MPSGGRKVHRFPFSCQLLVSFFYECVVFCLKLEDSNDVTRTLRKSILFKNRLCEEKIRGIDDLGLS